VTQLVRYLFPHPAPGSFPQAPAFNLSNPSSPPRTAEPAHHPTRAAEARVATAPMETLPHTTGRFHPPA